MQPPPPETQIAPEADSGNRYAEPGGDIDRYPPAVAASAGLANQYSEAEADILRMIGEGDALLAPAQSAQLQPPVELSAASISEIGQAVDGAHVIVSPDGDSLPVRAKGKTEIEGDVNAQVTGDVNATIRDVLNVRVVDVGVLIDAIADEVSTRIATGQGGFPAG